ncbi:MAG: restriction endonuclease subunit S [Pseudoalteromonas sp.]
MENSVTTYTVQELVDLGFLAKPLDGNHGGIHPKSSDFVESGIPFVMASDLKNGGVDTNNCKFISLEQSKTLRKGFAKEGDILLSHKATIGRTAIVGEIESEYIVLTPQVTYYRVLDKTKINPKYLKYYFDSIEFQSLFEQWAGGGSTRLYLGITGQMKLPIKLPHINTQNWIADNIDSFDLKLLLNRKTNQTLEQMAQALFKSWFVDFDPIFDNALASGMAVNDFHEALQKKALARQQQRQQVQQQIANGEPSAGKELEAKPLPENISQLFPSEFEQTDEPSIGINGWIPKGWENGTLSSVAEAISGYAFKSKDFTDEGESVIKIKNIKADRTVDLNDVQKVPKTIADEASKFYLEDGDLIMAMTGATVGKFGVVVSHNSERLLLNQRVCKLSMSDVSSNAFLYIFLSKPGVEEGILSAAQGSAQPNISAKEILMTSLLVPSKELIIEFSHIYQPFLEKIIAARKQSKELEKLRDTLLPKLISGELTINKDIA